MAGLPGARHRGACSTSAAGSGSPGSARSGRDRDSLQRVRRDAAADRAAVRMAPGQALARALRDRRRRVARGHRARVRRQRAARRSRDALLAVVARARRHRRHAGDGRRRPARRPSCSRCSRRPRCSSITTFTRRSASIHAVRFLKLIGAAIQLWIVPINGTTPAPQPQRDAIDARVARDRARAIRCAYLAYRLDAFAEVLGLRDKFHGRDGDRARGAVRRAARVLRHRRGMAARSQLPGERFCDGVREADAAVSPARLRVARARLLVPARRHRDVVAILLSGIGMELSLLPLAVTPDYRYSHWLVVSHVPWPGHPRRSASSAPMSCPICEPPG